MKKKRTKIFVLIFDSKMYKGAHVFCCQCCIACVVLPLLCHAVCIALAVLCCLC